MAEKLFLIDAMAMIYRAYFAMISNPLINSKGKNTSAAFGFFNSLFKILDDEKPQHIAVCFDTEKPTFRHKEFPEYKAKRQEIPTDMPWQISKVKEIVKALNIPILEMDGFEADDIIGTLVRQAEEENVQSFMVTPDKDFMQLVSETVFLYKPSRNIYGSKIAEIEVIGIDGVIKKFGVPPEKVIDVLALMGDASDNIPGVRGVGEKTAIALIQEFGSIENMYESIDKITKPKLKENLILNRDTAFLSKMLVTICTDCPLNINFHTLNKKDPDLKKIIPLFEEMEFKTFIKKLSPSGKTVTVEKKETISQNDAFEEVETETTSFKGVRIEKIKVDIPEEKKKILTLKDVKHDYKCIESEEEFLKLVKEISKQELISFNTETDTMDSMYTNLVGMSFCFKEKEAYYIPVHGIHKSGKDTPDNSLFAEENEKKQKEHDKSGIDINFALEKIKPILEDKKKRFIGQNIKYDYIVMRNYGVEIANIFFDTLIGGYILSPEGHHDMDSLSEKYLNYKPISIKELIGTGKDQLTMDKIDVEKCGEYASEDADITLQLFFRIKYELQKINLLKLCTQIEFPLIKVLSEMEFEGIRVDDRTLSIINKETEKLIKEYEEKIYAAAGEKFNINSTKQLAEILFTKLSLTPPRKTKTGFSTDVRVLEELKYKHEIASLLVDYRMLTKLKSTYLDGLKKAINPKTKRVHTCFNQIIAATGRLSSTDPNLQNIPIRTEAGRSIRKAFVPRNKDWEILAADYSQIELRIMAHYADDENMINAFKRKHDIHTETSMRVFNLKSKDEVTPGMRRKAKEVNFGIIYGIGAFGLSNRLDIKNTEAKEIIDRYFHEYPKVKKYMEDTKKFARENGYVETLKGRRRYLPQINNQNATARAADERAAINMPIQGTAADMIKIAMINIFDEFKKKMLESKMLLQVHDELVFEVKRNEIETVKKIVEDKMKKAIPLKVPIEVEMGEGNSWYEAH